MSLPLRRVLPAAVVAAVALLTGSAAAVTVTRPAGPPVSDHPLRYVLALTGDTLIHPAVARSAASNAAGGAYDFGPMFDEVAPLLRAADLALCHLEVPLDPDSTVSGFPLFSAPAELADDLSEAGFDGCSTASNHSLDRGVQGVFDTLDLLEAAGLGRTGTSREPDDTGGTLYDLGGLVVGHLSYTYGVQFWSRAGDRDWIANRIETDEILEQASVLRSSGADFVAVSLHWGAEFQASPNAAQRRVAAELLESSSIDMIVGHHPHVLQPVARVAGKPVLFSLGNFVSNQTSPCCPPESEEGAIVFAVVEFGGDGWHVSEIRHVPTWVNRRGGHVVTPALGDAAEKARQRSRLSTAASRGAARLGSTGPGMSPDEALAWISDVSPSRFGASMSSRTGSASTDPGGPPGSPSPGVSRSRVFRARGWFRPCPGRRPLVDPVRIPCP